MGWPGRPPRARAWIRTEVSGRCSDPRTGLGEKLLKFRVQLPLYQSSFRSTTDGTALRRGALPLRRSLSRHTPARLAARVILGEL